MIKRYVPVRKLRPGTRRGQPTKEEKGVTAGYNGVSEVCGFQSKSHRNEVRHDTPT